MLPMDVVTENGNVVVVVVVELELLELLLELGLVVVVVVSSSPPSSTPSHSAMTYADVSVVVKLILLFAGSTVTAMDELAKLPPEHILVDMLQLEHLYTPKLLSVSPALSPGVISDSASV